MTLDRRIAWPLVITCGLFLASLLGILGFRLFAFGSSVTGNKPGSIEFDGRTRTYFVHLPPAYNGETLMPVVIVLHGAAESPEGVEKLSGMSGCRAAVPIGGDAVKNSKAVSICGKNPKLSPAVF